MKRSTPSRRKLDRLNAERRQARAGLADQVAHARTALSPHHLAALWRAQQVRKLSGAGRQALQKVANNRTAIAGGLVATLALFSIPMMWRRWRSRNNPADSDI